MHSNSNVLRRTSILSSSRAAANPRIMRPTSSPTMLVKSVRTQVRMHIQYGAINLPSSGPSLGNRLISKFRAGALATGDVTRTSQTFWKKNAGPTVPDKRSNSARTLSKNSPASSSSPGRRASISARVAGRIELPSGRKWVS